MNNQTTTNNQPDPALEVEDWKDNTDKIMENMSLEEIKVYYDEALDLVKKD